MLSLLLSIALLQLLNKSRAILPKPFLILVQMSKPMKDFDVFVQVLEKAWAKLHGSY
jgi:hypothetical protein